MSEKWPNLIAAAPDLADVALAYERWEADLILDPRPWVNDIVTIPAKLWDRFMEIQAMRNAALKKARGES